MALRAAREPLFSASAHWCVIRSERATASSHFKQAKQLADEDNDTIGSDAAKRWIRKAYRP